MRYETLACYRAVQTGKDALGNAIKTPELVKSVCCRRGRWNEHDVALYGRTVTENTMKMLVRTADAVVADFVEYGGKKWTADMLSGNERWIVYAMKAWR